MINTLS
ncbi:unnamed protein product [Staurois parvus]|nr:unnamed protein product [Staurois parvus]